MIQHTFTENLTEFKPALDIFVINGTLGNDQGVPKLMDLMGNCGALFYKSSVEGKNGGSCGLIACDDTLIVKVNSQWVERGGRI